MRRARETAEPLAAALGLDVEIVDGLIEYDSTSADYIPMAELQATNDPRWLAMVEGRWEELGAGPAHVFKARVAQCVDEIVDRFPGRRGRSKRAESRPLCHETRERRCPRPKRGRCR